jgi:hypothetical protein
MTFNPHPLVLSGIATQRHADLQAHSDRERLLKLCQSQPEQRQPWANPSTARTLTGLLSLLLTAVRTG